MSARRNGLVGPTLAPLLRSWGYVVVWRAQQLKARCPRATVWCIGQVAAVIPIRDLLDREDTDLLGDGSQDVHTLGHPFDC